MWFQKKAEDPNSIDGRIAIGYWHETKQGSSSSVYDAIDKDWDKDERQMVLDYLKLASMSAVEEQPSGGGPTVLASWRGLSMCRICDQVNGNQCHGDAIYNWPQGYGHYIEKHNVKPPQKFIDHVRQQQNSGANKPDETNPKSGEL